MLGREILEQLHLRHLRAGVRRSAHDVGIGRGNSDEIGIDAHDRRIRVTEREERVRGDHCPFDVGLPLTESLSLVVGWNEKEREREREREQM